MKKTIMVVDDNPDVIYSLKKGLEGTTAEYDIIGAENGQQCFELLQSKVPDLIILDIMMPGMSGWQIFDKLKENASWQSIPIVFLTARTDDTAKKAGGFLGEDYIEKPFNIKDLKYRIDKILKKKEP